MKTFSRVYSAQPYFLKGHIVNVEVDISRGLHSFTIVGLAGKAVEEARDRVGSAIKNSGFPPPKSKNQKVLISLAPAELRKDGSFFDIAIALGYLLSANEITFNPTNKIFLGELALNGDILPVRGILPITQRACDAGFKEIYVPKQNADEAALIRNIKVYTFNTLLELVQHINTKGSSATKQKNPHVIKKKKTVFKKNDRTEKFVDFSDIVGQEVAKRCLEIAAAGGHNIMMYGPPGTGKTMLAKAFMNILPSLDYEDALEVTSIHSIAGTLNNSLITKPPFRSPHHSSSQTSILGGGVVPRPGEITLSHHGVLFMDEFLEFDRKILEALRQPLEDRCINISRAKGSVTFPTKFILVAAMNPPSKKATASEVAQYYRKISGPIMDRIDIWVSVEHVEYKKLLGNKKRNGDSTHEIQQRILRARFLQKERFKNLIKPHKMNAEIAIHDIEILKVNSDIRDLLNTGAQRLNLSPRSYYKVLKLARTIADLDKQDNIKREHIFEALQYRPQVE